MAAKKHTFIFKLGDPGVTEDILYRLIVVVRDGPLPLSYKASYTNHRPDSVQLFTYTSLCLDLLGRAGWSKPCTKMLTAARRNGDLAVGKASKRLDDLRRAANVRAVDSLRPVKLTYDRDDTARLNWLEAHEALLNYPNTGSGPHVALGLMEHYYGSTYRDAIDRAMAGHAEIMNRCEIIAEMPGGTKRSKRSA